MKIRELLKPEAVRVDAEVKTKEEALNMLIDLHDQAGNLSDKAVYARDVFEREAECVTAIGQGIAIPHAKSAAVRTPGLAALTVRISVNEKQTGLVIESGAAHNCIVSGRRQLSDLVERALIPG